MAWWVWVVGGLALGILEVLVPGYVFAGFALGAVATGLLVWAGLAPGGLAPLFLMFAVLSLLAWVAMRRLLGVRRGQVKRWDRDINEN